MGFGKSLKSVAKRTVTGALQGVGAVATDLTKGGKALYEGDFSEAASRLGSAALNAASAGMSEGFSKGLTGNGVYGNLGMYDIAKRKREQKLADEKEKLENEKANIKSVADASTEEIKRRSLLGGNRGFRNTLLGG